MSDASVAASNEKNNSKGNSKQGATTARDVFAKMDNADRAAATADAKGWEPQDGDEVRGLVIAVKSGISEYKERGGRNPHYPIIFIMRDENPEEVVAVHGFQTVLENELRAQRPMPGEDIYIKRLGVNPDKPVKKGESPVIRYAVYVDRDSSTAASPWEQM
jgi:hypothetical protein